MFTEPSPTGKVKGKPGRGGGGGGKRGVGGGGAFHKPLSQKSGVGVGSGAQVKL